MKASSNPSISSGIYRTPVNRYSSNPVCPIFVQWVEFGLACRHNFCLQLSLRCAPLHRLQKFPIVYIFLRYLQLGNDLREGNSKLSEGNKGFVFMHFALHIPCGYLHWGRWMPKAMHVLNFGIAFACETKIIGRNRHKPETNVIT